MPGNHRLDSRLKGLFDNFRPEDRAPGAPEREALPPPAKKSAPPPPPADETAAPPPPAKEAAPPRPPADETAAPPGPAQEPVAAPRDETQPSPPPEPELTQTRPLPPEAAGPRMGTQPIRQTRPLPQRQTSGLRTMPVITPGTDGGASELALSFQTSAEDWATLHIVDEHTARSFTEDDQLLVRQVAEQLSLALENARLFQETRRRSEELLKFRLGIERTDNAVFITGTDGSIQYVNEGFEKIYGYTRDDAMGKTPRILMSGLSPDVPYEEFWKRLMRGETITGEIVNKTRDGRLVSIAATTAPILDENEVILGFLAVHAEITAQKQAQETIRRRNEYLAASAEVARLVTSTLDLNTIFSRTVDLIQENFGHYHAAIFTVDDRGTGARLEAVASLAADELKRRGQTVSVGDQTAVGRVTATGVAVVVNDTSLAPPETSGALLPQTRSEAALPLRVGEQIIGAVDIQATAVDAFGRDEVAVLQTLADQVAVAINNARSYELSQKAVEEMRELDRLKSQFLANMSHELRTPLNSIIGFSRVILKGIDGPITDLQHQDLSAIYSAGQHLLSLINDVLDLSKIEAGKMELASEDVNIGELVNSVMSTMSGLVKDKPITVSRKVAPDLPVVRADAMRLRQVLINLLSNAAKFTEQGEIVVEAAVQTDPTAGREIVVSVTDTGPGITEEDQAKLFQAFSQVDDSPTRKTGGSGLGLSISQQLVQMHGGRMGVRSQVGKGSTFFFTLPLERPAELPRAEFGGRRLVLAIDDDPQVIGLYERYLKSHEYDVVPLLDATRALEQVAQLNPFAILLDIRMPGVDGWEVLRRLKADARARSTPVILCSILEDVQQGVSLGADDYLLKPVLEQDLVRALARLQKGGTGRKVLIVDDDPDELRRLSDMLRTDGTYLPALAIGGPKGWEMLGGEDLPAAVILDLAMPDLDGLQFLENMRADARLRDVPVLVMTVSELSDNQRGRVQDLAQQVLSKTELTQEGLAAALRASLSPAVSGA